MAAVFATQDGAGDQLPAERRWVGSLPRAATGRFFKGRQRELAAAASLLRSDETRLIVVAAAGGMGKTALASYLLRSMVDGPPAAAEHIPISGVAIVDLRAKSGVPFREIFFSCATLVGLPADRTEEE